MATWEVIAIDMIRKLRKKWHNDLSEKFDGVANLVGNSSATSQTEAEHIKSLQHANAANLNALHAEIQELKSILAYTNHQLELSRMAVIKTTPRRILSFAVDIIDACNLNCRGCLTFSPCAKRTEGLKMEPEQLDRDLKRISELFDQEQLQLITISGGEPLLHERVSEFPYIVRKYFPKVHLRLVTNGVLLLRQPEAFWSACRDTGLVIEQTKYPIELDFDQIRETAKYHGVGYDFMDDTGESQKTLMKFPISENIMNEDKLRDQNERNNFMRCWEANQCLRLGYGKMYTCSRIPHMELFNRCFGTDYPISQADGIDIYKAQSSEEIFAFLATPAPFCRYCMPDKITGGFPWGTSELDPHEWIE